MELSINPPYFKYSVKESPYSGATSDLFVGNPNIYASFIAVCLSGLSNEGQLIFITPRSFTNGLYFKGLRHYLFRVASLEKIHIFKSRDKVFKDAQVLQENIICKFVKSPQNKQVIVTSSQSDEDMNSSRSRIYPDKFIIDKSNDLMIIHIPESDNDAEIMKRANQLKSDFTKSGYRISTGPVVEHRTKDYIYSEETEGCVPLLRPHNIKFMSASWTGKEKKDAKFSIEDSSVKHLLPNKTYVVLKRFSSKDEKKRLTAGVYVSDERFQYIGLGNKLNYIVRDDEDLSVEEALGLSAILNSTFMDSYFRCFSGNTQVNATEVRVMKFPSRFTVCEVGKKLAKENLSQDIIDDIVMESLFDKGENSATNGDRETTKY